MGRLMSTIKGIRKLTTFVGSLQKGIHGEDALDEVEARERRRENGWRIFLTCKRTGSRNGPNPDTKPRPHQPGESDNQKLPPE